MPAWMPAARAQQRRQRDEARGTDLPVTRVAQQRPRGLSSDVAADDDAEPTAPPAKLSATIVWRLVLMSPFILSASMPLLQQLIYVETTTFSASSVPLYQTSAGVDLQFYVLLVGFVTQQWSQLLEARRRQTRVPASAKVRSRWASTLGGCTTKDARSIRVWTAFDCCEAACLCAAGIFLSLFTKYPLAWTYRMFFALGCTPVILLVIFIIKRLVAAVVYVCRSMALDLD